MPENITYTSRQLTFTSNEVAELLQISRDYFYNRLKLLQKNGFPHRLPGLNCFSALQVQNWIDHNGSALPVEETTATALDREFGEAS